MIIGIHTRDNDLVVNPIRNPADQRAGLKHRRGRASDQPIQLTLESAIRFSPMTVPSRSPQEHPPAQALPEGTYDHCCPRRGISITGRRRTCRQQP